MNTIIIVYDPEQTDHRLDAEDEGGRLGDLEAYLRDHLDDKHVVAHINEIAGNHPEDIKSAAGHANRVLAALQAGAPDLEHRELSTILAALRYWQREGLMSNGHEASIACDGGGIEPLTASEIDDLCERLNCEDEIS